MLDNFCDHIQAASSSLVATHADMKNKLETIKSTLPDPVEIYAQIIDKNIDIVSTTKESLF